jgi:hypothetical protein
MATTLIRIAVMEELAGGQLEAMRGTTRAAKIFDAGKNIDPSSDATSVVNLCGLADFTVFTSIFRFIGGAPKDHLDLANSMIPGGFCRPGSFFMMAGSKRCRSSSRLLSPSAPL